MSDVLREQFEEGLAEAGFGAPLLLGGPFGRYQAAVCLKCGAAILLDDLMEHDDGTRIERGIFLHFNWHQRDDA